MEEWIDWSKKALSRRQDDLNDVSDEDLKRWWLDYRRAYNTKWGVSDGHIRKTKSSSKWTRLFQNKTKEEIEEMIAQVPSKQTRLYLRKTYL